MSTRSADGLTTVRGLKLGPPKESAEDEYVAYVLRLNDIARDTRPNFGNTPDRGTVRKTFRRLLAEKVRFAPQGQRLPDTGDTGTVAALPAGCELGQAAVYDDTRHELTLDADLWLALDFKNQAALIAHEEAYFDFRAAGEKTSEAVRGLVGRLFASAPIAPYAFTAGTGAFLCFSQSTVDKELGSTFHLRINPDLYGSTEIRFSRLSGRDTLLPVTLNVPVSLRVETLQPALVDDDQSRVEMRVTDPSAAFESGLRLGNEIFTGHSILLRYAKDRPLRLIHLDAGKNVLSETEVVACFPR